MTSLLACRPLALAGPAAVAGVVLSQGPATAGAAVLLLPLAWWVWRRDRAALLIAAALLAGLGSGTALARRTEALLRAAPDPHARAPPRAGACMLDVTRCGADPFGPRAWLEGRRADGLGVLCAWPGVLPPAVAPGARVRVTGRFFAPSPPGNPGQADGRAALAARGVSWRADLRTAANVELVRAAPPGPVRWLTRMRQAAAARLVDALPPETAALAAALLLGLRGGLAGEERVRFERTGTAHLLAISGMHVLLLAGLMHRLLRVAGAGPRAAAGATVTMALLYVPVAGSGAPIRRAVTMLACYCLALLRGRPADPASALGGAALLMALGDPADVFRVGFRLSFAAAAGIAWLAPGWHERWSRRHRLLARFPAVREDQRIRLVVRGYLLGAFPVALAAWVSTQALAAQAFGVVTPFAALVNVAVGPLFALMLPLVALVAAGATWVAPVVATIHAVLRAVLDAAAHLPGALVFVASAPAVAVAAWLAGCVLLRRRPIAGSGLLVVAVVLACATRPSPGPPGLVLLDVGHGQALLLRDRNGRTALVDGGSRGVPAPGRRVLLPALREFGIDRLDIVVCTHADADHWNAIPYVLGLVPAGRLVVGAAPPAALLAAADRYGVPVARARVGDELWGTAGARLQVLAAGHAVDGRPLGRNDGSLALVFEAEGVRALLPADRQDEGLRDLIRRGVPACDVLVAPHHGARCTVAGAFGASAFGATGESSSDGTAPGPPARSRLLIVSASRTSSNADTLAGYGATQVIRTSRRGCVVVRFARGLAPVVVPGPH